MLFLKKSLITSILVLMLSSNLHSSPLDKISDIFVDMSVKNFCKNEKDCKFDKICLSKNLKSKLNKWSKKDKKFKKNTELFIKFKSELEKSNLFSTYYKFAFNPKEDENGKKIIKFVDAFVESNKLEREEQQFLLFIVQGIVFDALGKCGM